MHSYIEHIMYLTALNLFFYWFIYGVIVSCRFGGACEVWTLVMSLPHTIMMIIWEVTILHTHTHNPTNPLYPRLV